MNRIAPRQLVSRATMAELFADTLTRAQIEACCVAPNRYDPVAGMELVNASAIVPMGSNAPAAEPHDIDPTIVCDPDVIAQLPTLNHGEYFAEITYQGRTWYSVASVAALRNVTKERIRTMAHEGRVTFIRVAKNPRSQRPLLFFDVSSMPLTRKEKSQE